ncbi:MAG: signal peptidase I [Bradymonadia bacterium]
MKLKTGALIIGPHRPPPQRGRKTARVFILLAIIGLVVARLFFFELVVIRGNTMAPTALDGDVVLIHRSRPPKLGDVVLIDTEEAGAVVRRILGSAGDVIQTEDGRLIRNGQPIEARKVGSFAYQELEEAEMPPRRQHFIREGAADALLYHVLGDHVGNVRPWALNFEPITVPPGHVFILCDNRPICPDGPPGLAVPESAIVGVVGVPLWLGKARVDQPATQSQAQ